MLEIFLMKNSLETPNLVKIEQNHWTVYMKILLPFIVDGGIKAP
jgi:hypothetical protein